MPFLALDAESHNVTLVKVELCIIVAPDVDLFVLFAVRKSVGGDGASVFAETESAGLQQGREKRGNKQVRIWKE